jgi:TRAP-type transport system small permease protein
MKENTGSETMKKSESSGAGKIAGGLEKIMGPVSAWGAYIGAAILGMLVLMLIYSIIARRVINVPLKGSMEMTELALGVITFFTLAFDSLKGESMVVELITERFPRRCQDIIGAIIRLLSTGILGILCWQLIVQGMRLYGYHQTTTLLSIPVYPFLYIAAFGTFLLAVIYLMHFLYSLDKAWRK